MRLTPKRHRGRGKPCPLAAASVAPRGRPPKAEACHLYGDPAATSDAPSDPFAMKTRPLSAETSTQGRKKAQSPNQQAGREGPGGEGGPPVTPGENGWTGWKEAREERGRCDQEARRHRRAQLHPKQTSHSGSHLSTNRLWLRKRGSRAHLPSD